jgi:predicted nucleotidyltransferase
MGTSEDAALLVDIRAAVREVEPSATVILYGSRARGDAAPDSDWDILVLVNGPVDHQRATAVRHRLYSLEFSVETCPVLSAIVRSRQDWDSPLYRAMPFHENVEREGIEL